MKKFYALFIAVLVAATAFAQAPKARRAMAMPAPLTAQKLSSSRTLTTFSLPASVRNRQVAKPRMRVLRRTEEEVSANYVRVSSVPEDWEGEYLIVYEEEGLAMNGGLADKLDAVENTIEVSVDDQEIESNETTDAASFTITAVEGGYAIKSHSGLYMGQTADANGLLSSAETAYVNTLDIDEYGDADIVSTSSAHLRFNASSNQMRFRYYKAATYENQQPVALYKKGGVKSELPGIVVIPENLETENYVMSGSMMVWGSDDWEELGINKTVQVGVDGTDIYIQGMSYWFPEAWVKGVVADGKVLVPSNQLFGEDEYGPDVFVAYVDVSEEDYEVAENLEFAFDAETGTMTMQNWYGESEKANSKEIFNYCVDLSLTPGEVVRPDVVELPEGLTPDSYVFTAKDLSWDDNENEVTEDVELSAAVAIDGADVYIQGLCPYLPGAWVKGTLADGLVTVPAGQYFGTVNEKYDMYLLGYDDMAGVGDVTFTMGEEGVLTAQNWILINGSATKVECYKILTDGVLTPGEIEEPEVVVLPEGLTSIQYVMKGKSVMYAYDEEDEGAEPTPVYEDVTAVTHVAFDGTDVYIQGLSYDLLNNAWVKGTLADGVITVPAGQYLGTYYGIIDLYMVGFANDELCDIHFAVSADSNTLTAQELFGTAGDPNDADYLYTRLTDAVLTKVVEKAGMPLAPSVVDFEDWDEEYEYGNVELNIPLEDVDGNLLVVDKLSYKLYIDEAGTVSEYKFTANLYMYLEEDVVEMPYTFSDDYDFSVMGSDVYVCLNSPTETYDRIGVQSIYRGGGEENKTEIAWFDIDRTAIRGVEAGRQSDNVIYNLAGQRVECAVKGLYIVNGKKVLVK